MPEPAPVTTAILSFITMLLRGETVRDRAQRRLELPVDGVELVVAVAQLAAAARSGRPSLTSGRIASQPPTPPAPTPAARAAPRDGAGMVEHRPQLHAEHVGQDLLPQRGVASAVGDPRLRERDAALGEHLDVVAEAVGDRLQRRPVQVAAVVAEVQADERAAQGGVVQRRLLAQEVGQADDAAGARRASPRPRRRAAASGTPPLTRASQRSRLPLVAMQPLGSHAPAGWASRYSRSSTSGDRADDEDVAGAAELDQPVAGLEQAGTVGRADMVGPADRRSACPRAGRRPRPRSALTSPTTAPGARTSASSSTEISARSRTSSRGSPSSPEQPALDRPVALDVGLGSERPGEPVVGAGHRGGVARTGRARGAPASAASARPTAA